MQPPTAYVPPTANVPPTNYVPPTELDAQKDAGIYELPPGQVDYR